jgi:hypothetical protein
MFVFVFILSAWRPHPVFRSAFAGCFRCGPTGVVAMWKRKETDRTIEESAREIHSRIGEWCGDA